MHPKYKRMLKGMQAREVALLKKHTGKKKSRTPHNKSKISKRKKIIAFIVTEWSLYILRCSDGSLYTGVTNNIERRLKMHGRGVASRYTRTRRPIQLLYQEKNLSRTQALVRECAVKAMSKEKKEKLIANWT